MRLLETWGEDRFSAGRSPVVLPAGAFAAGILVDGRVASLSCLTWSLTAAVIFAATIGAGHLNRRSLSTILLAATIGCLGGFWHHWRWNEVAPDDLSLEASETPAPLVGRFRLSGSPRELPAGPFAAPDDPPLWKVAVQAVAVRDGSDWRAASGTGTLVFPYDGRLGSTGDVAEVRGFLAAPSPPKNPGEPDFRATARGDGERFVVRARFADSVRPIARGSGLDPSVWLERARDYVERTFFETMSPSSAAAATALIVGRRDRMDRDAREDFFLGGAVHLLAISGLHVGVLIAGLRFVAVGFGLSRTRRAYFIFAATLAFAIFAAAQAPILRAATLLIFAGVADLRGRRMTAVQGLSIAAFVVLAWRPWDLFDVGAQLSFLAVGALAWHGERWNEWLAARRATSAPYGDPGAMRLAEVVGRWSLRIWTAGACVWIATLPLVAFRFHFVSFSAMLFNPFYGLLVAVALYAAVLVIPLRIVFGSLADPLAWTADWTLAMLGRTLDWTSRLPYSFVWTAGPSAMTATLFYVGLAAIAVGLPGRRHAPAIWALIGVWAVVSATDVASRRDTPDVRVTVLAVGHAAATLIETPDGALLCDAGTSGSPRRGARVIADALWHSGRTHLDAVVISHRDADHFNALGELTRMVSIGVVYVPENFFEEGDGLAAELRRTLDAAAVPHRTILAGKRFAFAETGAARGATISVLHPPAGFHADDDNETSVTLLVESAGTRLLLPGDLEGEGMERLLALDLPPIDVTLAPHHGSLSSAPEAFAESTKAGVVIVSGDDLERWDEFADAWSATNARLYLTAREGAVQVRLTERGPRVRAFLADPW